MITSLFSRGLDDDDDEEEEDEDDVYEDYAKLYHKSGEKNKDNDNDNDINNDNHNTNTPRITMDIDDDDDDEFVNRRLNLSRLERLDTTDSVRPRLLRFDSDEALQDAADGIMDIEAEEMDQAEIDDLGIDHEEDEEDEEDDIDEDEEELDGADLEIVESGIYILYMILIPKQRKMINRWRIVEFH